MPHEINPYESPKYVERPMATVVKKSGEIDPYSFFTWPFALGLNLIIPLMFGWDMTSQHARVGMGLAIGLFLIGGWLLCYAQSHLARRMIIGAFVTSLTQLFPVLQIFAGMVAMGIAEALHIGSQNNDDMPNPIAYITTVLGGFVVTFLVGCLLLIPTVVVGLFAWMISPKKPRADNKSIR